MKTNIFAKLILAISVGVIFGGVSAVVFSTVDAPGKSSTTAPATRPGNDAILADLTDSFAGPRGRIVIEDPLDDAVVDAPMETVPHIPTKPNAPTTPAVPAQSLPPPPMVDPPAPPPVDHTPRFRHNDNYKPDCGAMAFKYSQEMSQGSTAVITVPYKYDVTSYSTPGGFGIGVHICSDQN